jgi:subtilisin-like proprotein convertase family protein
MKNLDHHIIRRASDFHCTEPDSWTLLDVIPPAVTFMEKIFGTKKIPYYVAKGTLEKSINLQADINGNPDQSNRNRLEIHLTENDHPIYLRPQITILGVSGNDLPRNQNKILNWLLPHYEDQRTAIRERIYNLIHRALGVPANTDTLDLILSGRSMDSPVFETLAKDASLGSSRSGRTIQDAVAEELGLLVSWKLALEQNLTDWIAKLKAQLPAKHTAIFNAESRTGQFRLTYSVKVVEVKPSRWHLAQARMRESGKDLISVESEISNVHGLVHQTLDQAFGVFGGQEKMWEHPRFWAGIVHVLKTLVAPRIEREFGYKVEFADFKRERTQAELEAINLLEDPQRLAHEFTEAEDEYRQHSGKLKQYRLAYGSKMDDKPNPVREALEYQVTKARERMDSAQKAMETTSYGSASDLSSISFAGFSETFSRFFHMLHMEPPKHLIDLEAESPVSPPSPPPAS